MAMLRRLQRGTIPTLSSQKNQVTKILGIKIQIQRDKPTIREPNIWKKWTLKRK